MTTLNALAFDFGVRRIGVAVGQSLTGTASPLETIENPRDGVNWERVDALVEQWRPDALIVGIPLTEAGEIQAMTKAARRFAGLLAERTRLPVYHTDERYTSRAAADRLREQRRSGAVRRRAGRRSDAVAAQLILEQWFAENATSG